MTYDQFSGMTLIFRGILRKILSFLKMSWGNFQKIFTQEEAYRKIPCTCYYSRCLLMSFVK